MRRDRWGARQRVLVLSFAAFWLGAGRASGTGQRPEPSPAGIYWISWSSSWEEAARKAAGISPPPVSERALRRMRARGAAPSADSPADRPVPEGFLSHLRDLGLRPRVASRFLRAVSAALTEAELARLARDPAVASCVPVRRLRGPIPPAPEPGERPRTRPDPTPEDSLPDPRMLRPEDYGASLEQCRQLQVPELHRLGLSGRGVLVCVLDGGFLLRHEAFARTALVAARDFVERDGGVGWDPSRPNDVYNVRQMNDHGTYTWSALGGFAPGRLIGPAYRASYALGRTEIVSIETRLEEDLYVAGLEWADSLGADVVSTSLGYLEFDSGFSYWPEELDGRTAVTSRAAAELARRGVLLVTAMGNEGPGPRTLITPADAESVCSVGAVDSGGRVAAFSSRGPNARDQIKPDVCARGVGTACATASEIDGYGRVDGTSLATPLIAGLAALLIEAHPDWPPVRVIEALRAAGSQAERPDNDRGYGVPDGLRALGVLGPDDPGLASLDLRDFAWIETAHSSQGEFFDSLPSPGEEGTLRLRFVNRGAVASPPVRITVASVPAGIESAGDSADLGSLAPGSEGTAAGRLRLRIAEGHPTPGEARIALRIRTPLGSACFRPVTLAVVAPTWQMRPFPNPVTRGADLACDLELPRAGTITVRVFDAGGRLRAQPFEGHPVAARDRIRWTPDPELPTGVYFLRIEGVGSALQRRFVLLR